MEDPWLQSAILRYQKDLAAYQRDPSDQRYTHLTIQRYSLEVYCRIHGLAYPEKDLVDPGKSELRVLMTAAWQACKRNGRFTAS